MPPVPRYRPGPGRGEDTRRRLVEAAIDTFAALGYEGATTRALADRADVTLPAIQYYFGGKEGLYRAAIEHITAWFDDWLAPASERLSAALARPDTPAAALRAQLYEVFDAFVALVVGGNQQQTWCLFLTRTEIERMAALEPLHDALTRRLVMPCAGALARLLGRDGADETIVLRVLAIVGQITIFGKNGPQRVLGWTEVGDDQIRTVRALIREHTDAILHLADTRATHVSDTA